MSDEVHRAIAQIRFFGKLAPLILSGRKSATIRDDSEAHYQVGQILEAITHEDGASICQIEILSIEQVSFDTLNRSHAKAEGLPFTFLLKRLIRKIYPRDTKLYFIRFITKNVIA
ncbi:ASCH domain-containing protein [Marinomonas agarivorans]|nr:ASCH domain-containing protein [Marinomonas agarivorans]